MRALDRAFQMAPKVLDSVDGGAVFRDVFARIVIDRRVAVSLGR